MAEVSKFLQSLGVNPIIVGIIAVFALLQALEFSLRYVRKGAVLARWAALLGSQKLSRRARKAIQLDLATLRSVRRDGFARSVRGIRLNAFYAAILVFVAGAFAIITLLLFSDSRVIAAWVGTSLGMGTRYLTLLLAGAFTEWRFKRWVADPAGFRKRMLQHLARLER